MFDYLKTLLFLLKLNIKLKELLCQCYTMIFKVTLPCPVDGMLFKHAYKVKVFCNIDPIAMASACPFTRLLPGASSVRAQISSSIS